MKRILLLLLTIPTLVFAQEKTVSSDDFDRPRRNANGESIVQFEDKTFTGICQDYHSNGMILTRGDYKDGLKDGIWSTYYDDGKIQLRENYVAGRRVGFKDEYLENGDLVSTRYNNGTRTSVFTLNGGAVNNEFDLESPDKNGQKTAVTLFELQKTVDSIGNELYFFNNKLYTGSVKVYNLNGTVYIAGDLKNGKKDGVWEHNSFHGNLMSKETFKSGVKDGVSEEYNYDGKLSKREFWKNNKKDGLSEEYHDNGELWMKGNYINDKKVGEWKYYDENGKLIRTEIYEN